MNKGKTNVFLWAIYLLIIGAFVVIGINSFNNKKISEAEMMTNYENYIDEPSYSDNKQIGLEKSVYYVTVGNTIQIKVLSNNGDSLKWQSDDSSICSVSETGIVTGIKEGKTKVTATYKDTEATVEIVVIDENKTTIEEAKKQEAKEYYKEQEKEYETPPLEDASSKPDSSNPAGDSSSSDSGSGSSSSSSDSGNGSSSSSGNGSGASSSDSSGGSSSSSSDPSPSSDSGGDSNGGGNKGDNDSGGHVIKPIPGAEITPIIPVSSVTLNKTSVTGYTLESDTLTATVSPSNATNKSVKWSSSNTNVVSVDNGKLSFKKSGSATITATAGVKSVTADVTVKSRERIYFISHKESSGTDHITGDAILLESNGSYAMIDMGHTQRSTEVINFLKNKNVKNLEFALFSHLDNDHAANLREILNSGVHIEKIWMKNYDVASYRENYIPNLDNNGIDHGLETQDRNVSTYRLNKSLSRFRHIIYLSEYSKLKDHVDGIKYVSSDEEGTTYSFNNLMFNMTLYNNKRNVNAIRSENYNSISSLISVNNHKVLLTGDDFDTKKFNETADKVGKVTVLKVPHHGSGCSLNPRRYDGNKVVGSGGTEVTSTALGKLKARYYVVTSTSKKIDIIKDETESDLGKVKCVDRVYQYDPNANIRFVDETPNALVLDLTNPKKITFYSE